MKLKIKDIDEAYVPLPTALSTYEISRLYDGNTRNTNNNTYSDQIQDTEFLSDLNKCIHKISSDFNIPFVPV